MAKRTLLTSSSIADEKETKNEKASPRHTAADMER
ncbi:hypothetical protein SNOG_03064 [Parastagonospora nodorum SN15]|uniref:Uncharacterized protein n=1 Tax=Phaeosphaeria nodorum (strain SN15 / ATCC MYA-4574 / FGSC 10173) TaxID=321614 RepID=Q0UYV0_PHANO|nr:hypothetical protein SNOG_03064 [Parastagonospora nodorum SN15]EAT89795.1 hypothetical protein SNOG_03064 [Parastagonospora nodorum SN15]